MSYDRNDAEVQCCICKEMISADDIMFCEKCCMPVCAGCEQGYICDECRKESDDRNPAEVAARRIQEAICTSTPSTTEIETIITEAYAEHGEAVEVAGPKLGRWKKLLGHLDFPLSWWNAGEKCYCFQLGTACLGGASQLKECQGFIEPDVDPQVAGVAADDVPMVVNVLAESQSQSGNVLFELVCDVPIMIAHIAELQVRTAAYAEREARIAELEAVVEKWPETKDGVKVRPGMVVHQTTGKERTVELGYRCDDGFPFRFRNFHWPNYFSTRAAAEKAKEKVE